MIIEFGPIWLMQTQEQDNKMLPNKTSVKYNKGKSKG